MSKLRKSERPNEAERPINFKEEFKHLPKFEALINSIEKEAQNAKAAERLQQRCVLILDEYQEQPHLLDPHLEALINKLLDYVTNHQADPKVVHLSFSVMYLISKTRGYKVIIRYLPHEVSDLERVLDMLQKQRKGFKNWETKYMLLLWLSVVCMIPFDMTRLDNIDAKGDSKKKPVMDRIIEFGQSYIDATDKSQDAAAYMLAKFMTRPDVKSEKMSSFLEWNFDLLNSKTSDSNMGQSLIMGLLSTLALLLKHGKREDLIPYSPKILEILTSASFKHSHNTVIRKLNMKVLQRIAMTFLRAKVASWRYQRGSRSLADNLSHSSNSNNENVQNIKDTEDEEEYDIPEELEEIIEQLLNGLRDPGTIVRWSAAKGMGRVASRLPRELADEVVGSIMELFSITEKDSSWHGGCLALAELGRRGLLLPQRLPDVVPVIIKALAYDEKHGHSSVGSHVRDAACYVCWSFARAYEPADLKKYVSDIANALIIVSILDREVNVRRAASAAFQENVGRQGNFPHGIDILTNCDYFAVGNITNCYLTLVNFITGFSEYQDAIIKHLYTVKSYHWDVEIRELSAQGLSSLVERSPDYLAKSVLTEVLKDALSLDLNQRHGALLMTARIVASLSEVAHQKNKTIQDVLGNEVLTELKELLYKYQEKEFFKGKSGEVMMEAMCCLIERLSIAKMPFKGDQVIDDWQAFIEECLESKEPKIQNAGLSAVPNFFAEYYREEDGNPSTSIPNRIIPKYIKGLKSNVEPTRIGCALALAVSPEFLFRGSLQNVIEALIDASKTQKGHMAFVHARKSAIIALKDVCNTVGIDLEDESGNNSLCQANIPHIYEALLDAIQDYTKDHRGDVGAFVREAAMIALQDVTSLVVKSAPHLLQAEWSVRMICSVLQQSCEKIDRTRVIAGKTLIFLLHHDPEVPHIPHIKKLQNIFGKRSAEYINWSSSAQTFPLMVKALDLPTYTYSVMLGIIPSLGGLGESIAQSSRTALLDYLSKKKNDFKSCNEFAKLILKICDDHKKQDRIMIPMFKMVERLMTFGAFRPLHEDETQEFASAFVDICKSEVTSCNTSNKVQACIDLFCSMLEFGNPVRKKIIFQLLVFMCYKYPTIRLSASKKFYEATFLYEGMIEDEHLGDVIDILSETQWDKPVDEIRPLRNQLCDMLGVPKPVAKKKTIPEA